MGHSKAAVELSCDLQLSKEPVIRATEIAHDLLKIMGSVANAFSINEDRLRESMTGDLYMTYRVYRKVKQGTSFRQAYREIASAKGDAESIKELERDFEPLAAVLLQDSEAAMREINDLQERIDRWSEISTGIARHLRQ